MIKRMVRILAVIACAAWIALVGTVVLWAMSLQPDMDRIVTAQVGYTLLDAGERPMGEDQRANAPVTLEAIPLHVQQAFLAAEDIRFYRHKGIDPIRIAGAAMANLKSGRKIQGASTITQQLIKRTHLTPEKSWSRKIREAILALKLERRMEKDEILEAYLNSVYFGGGAYGIAAAAQHYFSCSVQELTVAQGAALAGIVKAPSYYAPHLDRDACISRRNLILSLMQEEGFLTQEEAASARSETLTISAEQAALREYPWYRDAVLREAMEVLSCEENALAGLVIYTAMDRSLQESLEASVSHPEFFPEDAEDGTKVECALCAIDPQSGLVTAQVGGREYRQRYGFDRAEMAYRQPGSAIKPLLSYAPALETGRIEPASLLQDEPKDFSGYQPGSASGTYWGTVTARTALAHSLNVPAVQLLSDVGWEESLGMLEDLGISVQERHLAMALGGFTYGVTPKQMAAAYAALAQGGEYTKPSCIRKIETMEGEILYEFQPEPEPAMSEETAFLLLDMLKSCARDGTAKGLKGLSANWGAKTGTVSDATMLRDLWLCTVSADLSLCVWMGFDETDAAHHMDPSHSGGGKPVELTRSVLATYEKEHPIRNLKPPEGVVLMELDLWALQQGRVELASNFTPESLRREEWFRRGREPRTICSYWDPPESPNDLTLTLLQDGVELQFSAGEDLSCRIYRRISAGEAVLIAAIPGQEKVTYRDDTVPPGEVCSYQVQLVSLDTGQEGELSAERSIYVPQRQEQKNPFAWIWEEFFAPGKRSE